MESWPSVEIGLGRLGTGCDAECEEMLTLRCNNIKDSFRGDNVSAVTNKRDALFCPRANALELYLIIVIAGQKFQSGNVW